MTAPALLTYKDVAERWRTSVRTVERAVARGKLKKTVISSRVVRFTHERREGGSES